MVFQKLLDAHSTQTIVYSTEDLSLLQVPGLECFNGNFYIRFPQNYVNGIYQTINSGEGGPKMKCGVHRCWAFVFLGVGLLFGLVVGGRFIFLVSVSFESAVSCFLEMGGNFGIGM
jgi:hypothetical protein